MNKRILFAILAVAFFTGAILRWSSGGTAFGLMFLFLAAAAAWFSFKSRGK
ncbi:MAG: hypothetical protein E7C36_15915 [Mixta calida]|jgi:NADH:ubiquinone oxidoreductase subunit 6 (subunit J)|uniref:hypothetical protein n=1 Tax=Mixta calida TaxID=665913 RepID=UPI000ACCC7C3|nr:hypothetical protein [Mixta calida]MBS6059388.1 hypothetical protein [Pantoea sp.]KAF0861212.1 hypothetical protein Y888_02865 [Mixta calida B021323]MDU2734742.1 hypothetical protein [Mixta calida]MDU3814762.1 hypothetical protein [Pantoea sp.]MDU4291403.1 hypothetical protein [Mixta calida]